MIVWNSAWDKGDRIPSKNLECYTPRPSFWAVSAISRCFEDANLCSAKLEFWAPLQDIIGIINANNLKNPFSVLLMQATSNCMCSEGVSIDDTSPRKDHVATRRICSRRDLRKWWCNKIIVQVTTLWPLISRINHDFTVISMWFHNEHRLVCRGWMLLVDCFSPIYVVMKCHEHCANWPGQGHEVIMCSGVGEDKDRNIRLPPGWTQVPGRRQRAVHSNGIIILTCAGVARCRRDC